MKYFYFGVWSISYNYLHDTTRNETHCGCHFIAVIVTNFISCDKILCKHYPKWNYMKGNICACFYFIKTKMIGFHWMGRFFRNTWNEILPHFARNEKYCKQNLFYGGLKFHFGSHVNTLLIKISRSISPDETKLKVNNNNVVMIVLKYVLEIL